jgi:hypothetical protein
VTNKLTQKQVCPYPTVVPSTSKRGGKVKKESRILTLTPKKEHTETLAAKKKASGTLNSKSKRKPKTSVKELDPYEMDSKSSNSNFTIHDESDDFAEETGSEPEVGSLTQSLEPNDFVLVKFATKKTIKYFVGQMKEMGPHEYLINFFRTRPTSWKFCSLEIEDTASIDSTDVILKLPQPVVSGTSSRTVDMIFDVDLSNYHIN